MTKTIVNKTDYKEIRCAEMIVIGFDMLEVMYSSTVEYIYLHCADF